MEPMRTTRVTKRFKFVCVEVELEVLPVFALRDDQAVLVQVLVPADAAHNRGDYSLPQHTMTSYGLSKLNVFEQCRVSIASFFV